MLDRTSTLFSHVKGTDNPWVSGGLRDFFLYRDLGIAAATHGKVIAHLVKANLPPEEGTGWHRHEADFQIVIMIKGWAKFMYEDQVTLVEAGDCVHQRPGIRHYCSTIRRTWSTWRSSRRRTSRRWMSSRFVRFRSLLLGVDWGSGIAGLRGWWAREDGYAAPRMSSGAFGPSPFISLRRAPILPGLANVLARQRWNTNPLLGSGGSALCAAA
jgi:Cupin domain